MEYALETTETGWIARLEGGLTVEIEHPNLTKGGAIRGTFTVRRKAAVVYRDAVNLTSERERKRLIKRLASESVALELGLLVALDEACRQPSDQEAASSVAQDGTAPVPYRTTDNGLVYLKPTREGEVPVPLTNFTARIIGEVVRDDGAETRRSLEIEAHHGGQKHRFDIPSSTFHRMDWVIEKMGPTAVVYAGFGAKDHARTAIQLLSENVASRTVYAHLGWRKIGDEWCYLHAGGAIGTIGAFSGIEVDLPDELSLYTLPEPTTGDDLVKAVRASMQMLEVLPEEITFSVYCCIWRAAVDSCDFAEHLTGQTGEGKTAFAVLAQQHWGAGMVADRLPGSWSSTGNALEALAFTAKDALMTVDDLAPDGTRYDIQRQHKEAARLLRAQGNRSGRQRLRSDSTLQTTKYPRGLILSTGEENLKGHSVRARTLALEVPVGAMNWERLTRCQENAEKGLYAQAMAAFVLWVASRRNDLLQAKKQRIVDLREKASSSGGQHRRIPSIVAELAYGFEIFLRFAQDNDVLTEDEAYRWREQCWVALGQAAHAQARLLGGEDPVWRFFELLRSALVAGNAHLAWAEGKDSTNPEMFGWRRTIGGRSIQREDWQPQGQCAGWVQGHEIFLDPTSAYRCADRMTTDGLGMTARTLWKRMRERDILASWDQARGRNMVRRMLEGVRREVLHLKLETLLPQKTSQSSQSPLEPENSAPDGTVSWDGSGSRSAEMPHRNAPEESRGQEERDPAGPTGAIGPILEGEDTRDGRDSFLEFCRDAGD